MSKNLLVVVRFISETGNAKSKERIKTTIDKIQAKEKADFRKFYEAYKKDMDI